MTTEPRKNSRRRVLTIGASALAALTATGLVMNAFLAPPPKPAGTNSVITGDFQRDEYPNVPANEQFTSSRVVDGCEVGIGTLGSWQWTADTVRLRFRLTSTTIRGDDEITPLISSGPAQNIWRNPTMFDERVKAGRSYRFGPATVKVLQVWNSPIPQYRRAYLKVTFDESQILCPPPAEYTMR